MLNCPDCTRKLKKHCDSDTCDLQVCTNCCHFGIPGKHWVPAIDLQAERKAAWKFWRDHAT